MQTTPPLQLDLRLQVRDPRLGEAVAATCDWLGQAGLLVTVGGSGHPAGTLLVTDHPVPEALDNELATSDRPVLLVGPTLGRLGDGTLADAVGLLPGACAPRHEIRLRPGPAGADLGARSVLPVSVHEPLLAIDKVADDVEVLLAAHLALSEQPVATWRASTRVGAWTVGSEPASWADPALRRLMARWLRHCLGVPGGEPVRVGMLGFGAIGVEHATAIAAVAGLSAVAVCDRNEERVTAALAADPTLRVVPRAEDLLTDPEVDLVIVSTPPNTHADWAARALREGKHVVVEKPFALSVEAADGLIAEAEAGGLTLAVYQNRRWDADYLALKRAVQAGLLGEVFHMESFVGGYGHPCNYWHSDQEVSGGAIFDWGSHYLDWILDLLPQQVEHVTASTHKRVWHDVTNADHSRVTVRFVDGVEAEFIHSDLAAAAKPKWYVLGTEGALVGHWRHERVLARNAVGLLQEDLLAPADSPSRLELHAADGSRTELAIPPAPPQPFHRELADQLLDGLPMTLTPTLSRRNLAVMQAAMTSARSSGRPVPLP